MALSDESAAYGAPMKKNDAAAAEETANTFAEEN
jgi:hypothetical protein